MATYVLDKNILKYYNRGREQGRLESGLSRLEFLRTLDVFSRFLPESPLKILDVGGGAGRYAIYLSEQGHEVQLLDSVPLHVEQAQMALRNYPNASVILGDARALPFKDQSADVVLLLGPLYHLQNKADRLQALGEAYRTLKPNGLLLAALISRFAPAVAALQLLKERSEDDFVPYLDSDAYASGKHGNPDFLASNFTTAYFHYPDALNQEFNEAGFTLNETMALEGIAAAIHDLDNLLTSNVKLGKLMEMLSKLESEPSVLGVSPHLMVIAQKLVPS